MGPLRSFRERRPWLVGLTSIVVISLGMWLAFSVNRFEGLKGVYTVLADLEDAAGLQAGNEVRLAGVRVGQVKGVELTPDAARVEMEIEDDIRLPAETRVEVKLKTLLGQKFIDLQLPDSFLTAASGGADPEEATARWLEDGDVIPRTQTKVPFEIYQAATEGTDVLAKIDERSLRKMIDVLATTVGASKDELRRALVGLQDVGSVLRDKGGEISSLLRNLTDVSGTLAAGDQDIDALLARATEVLEVLANRRATISSLLRATNQLAADLGLLIEAARAPLQAGAVDLNAVLAVAQSELRSLEAALAELGTAQELFGRPLTFGRFIEGHVCAITTEDTCVPEGTPEEPGLPVKNVQPTPAPRAAGSQP